MAKKYRSTGTLQMGRVMHPAGAEVTIDDPKEVKRLLALKAIVPTDGVVAATPPIFDVDSSVKKLVPQIKASDDVATIRALREAEMARPDGARAGVITAIDERLDELDAAPGSGSANSEDDEE